MTHYSNNPSQLAITSKAGFLYFLICDKEKFEIINVRGGENGSRYLKNRAHGKICLFKKISSLNKILLYLSRVKFY